MTASQTLLKSNRFLAAKKELLESIAEGSLSVSAIRGSTSPEIKKLYLKSIQEFNQNRGRELYFPYLASGLGSGPFVELADGSVKFDMITGIGVNFFGHSNPQMISEMIDGLSADTMQGNLEPGVEAAELIKLLLSKVGDGALLKKGWLTTCGTMANEIALKIIRQKKAPATKVIAFKDCFCGRSTAMQEITDNPGYRQGQPVYGEVHYLSFYDPKLGLEKSIERSLGELAELLTRYPGKFAAFMLEIIQGEGGFNYAPRDFYIALFEEVRKAGIAVWADEIQTFGRTGELFAFQRFNLAEYIDVVTIAKMLQASAVLYSDEYNPKPGLVAGTFSGSTVALRVGKKTVEILCNEGFLGPDGKIAKRSQHFVSRLQALAQGSCKGLIGEIRAIGGMIAFQPRAGTMDDIKKCLTRLFDLGVVAFYCGHGPYLIRMLPPLGVMKDQEIDEVCNLIEKVLKEVGAPSETST